MDRVETLKKYLLSADVLKYTNEIIELIPALKFEIGFDQKSDWHSYDVWNHTIKAVESCDMNFEDRLVLLLHDIGKPFSYQLDNGTRHFKGHALQGSNMAYPILSNLGFKDNKLIEMISLIKDHSTKIEIENINFDNVDYYKKLLKIQKCDGLAYEKEHSKRILENLTETEVYINNLIKGNKKIK